LLTTFIYIIFAVLLKFKRSLNSYFVHPLTWHIAYTSACCYRTSRNVEVFTERRHHSCWLCTTCEDDESSCVHTHRWQMDTQRDRTTNL